MGGMVELIGAPFDLCGPMLGSRLGPMAVRLLEFERVFQSLGLPFTDSGDAFPLSPATPKDYGVKVAQTPDVYRRLSSAVESAVARGSFPLVVGGDHSLAIGSISGAVRAYGSEGLAVLWIDAHMDLHTHRTSLSGNVHGMPLGALTRLDTTDQPARHPQLEPVWEQIQSEIVPNPGLSVPNVAWLGLRSVDPGESDNYRRNDFGPALTMEDIDRDGVPGAMDRIDSWLLRTGAKNLWVSFDVDALDPHLAPGTGTRVRGGLNYREGHLVAELIYQMVNDPTKGYRLAGLDVVEVNPLSDHAGETAKVAMEWVSSLCGNTIMGGQQ